MRFGNRQPSRAFRRLLLFLFAAPICPAATWAAPGNLPTEWAMPAEIKTAPAFEAAVLPMRGSFAQHNAAVERLRIALRSAGVEPSGPLFGRYWSDPALVREQDFIWEVGYPVPHGTRLPPPFAIRTFPRQTVASLRLHGPYAESGRAWPAFFQWISANGYFVAGESVAFWSVAPGVDGSYTPETELRVAVRQLHVFPLLLHHVVCIAGVCVFGLCSLVYLGQRSRRRLSLWAGPLCSVPGTISTDGAVINVNFDNGWSWEFIRQ